MCEKEVMLLVIPECSGLILQITRLSHICWWLNRRRSMPCLTLPSPTATSKPSPHCVTWLIESWWLSLDGRSIFQVHFLKWKRNVKRARQPVLPWVLYRVNLVRRGAALTVVTLATCMARVVTRFPISSKTARLIVTWLLGLELTPVSLFSKSVDAVGRWNSTMRKWTGKSGSPAQGKTQTGHEH